MNPGRYVSCFGNPWDRPSQAFARYAEHAAEQPLAIVQELAAWIDGEAVVKAAEGFVHTAAKEQGWVRPGDPGE